MAILNKLKTIKAASDVVSETMGAVAKKSADEAGDSSTKPSAMTLGMVGNLLKSVDFTAMITRLEVLQRKNGLDLGILLTFLGQLKSVKSADQILPLMKEAPLKEILQMAEKFSGVVPGLPIVVKILKWGIRLLSVVPKSRLTPKKK